MSKPGTIRNRFTPRFTTQAWVLAGVVFICRLGAMVKLFMAIYLNISLGLSIEIIGLMLSCYGAGLVAGSYLAGVASDHWAARWLILTLILSSAAMLFALPQLEDLIAITVVLVASGAFDGGIRTLHQRLILDFCATQDRDRSQALSRVGINLGMACAGLIGGLLSDWDIRGLFYVSACLLGIAASVFAFSSRGWKPVGPTLIKNPTPNSEAGSSPYKNSQFLFFLVGCSLMALAYEPIYSTLGNYLIEYYRLTPAAIGWQFALNGLLVVTLQIPITGWTSAWGVRNQLLGGGALLGVGLALIPYGSGVAYLSACTVLWTLGELLFMPAMGIHVMQTAEGIRSGHYFGLYSLSWSAGTLLSPSLASQVYGRFGGDTLWLMCCALAMAGMALMGIAFKTRPT